MTPALLSRFTALGLFYSFCAHAGLARLGLNHEAQAEYHSILPQIRDASGDDIRTILKGGHIQMGTAKVEKWSDVAITTMMGKGAEIQRNNSERTKFYQDMSGKDVVERGLYILGKLGWEVKPKGNVPRLNVDCHGNEEMVKFVPAFYPVQLPVGVRHDVMYFRADLIDEKALVNAGAWLNGHTAEEMKKWIEAHDFFATNIPQEKLEDYYYEFAGANAEGDFHNKIGQGLWPGLDNLNPTYDGKVTMQEGIQAMRHVSGEIVELIEKQYGKGEFVCFRANRNIRSYHLPNELHIFRKVE